ncbi:TolB family protein [Micromonosporaceae bacterium Da 78-11]
MTTHLREELRREAATARTYEVYARSLVTARHQRRRTIVSWAVVVAALALVVPFVPRPQPVPAADGESPSLPDRLGLPAYGSLDVTAYPHLGAASALFSGSGGRFGAFADDADEYGLAGGTDDRYRTLHHPYLDGSALLSPDGRTVADVATTDGDRTAVQLIDLTTGDTRWLPGSAARTVAWSPDGRRLMVEDYGDAPLRIVDVTGGPAVPLPTLDQAQDPYEVTAAFAPDGRLAYVQNFQVHVVDTAGKQLLNFAAGAYLLTGKGSWTPDGTSFAMVQRTGRGWTPHWFDATTGAEVTGPGLPAVPAELTDAEPGPLDDAMAHLLGWRRDGTALVFADTRVLALTPGAGASVTVMTVPEIVETLDLADQAIAGGVVRPADPPFPIGPRLWLWPAGLLLAVLLLTLWSRSRRGRARRRRVAAVPWGTVNGTIP